MKRPSNAQFTTVALRFVAILLGVGLLSFAIWATLDAIRALLGIWVLFAALGVSATPLLWVVWQIARHWDKDAREKAGKP